jgi:hypothetical protein
LHRPQGRWKGGFCGHSGGLAHHINGVFAADMMAPASVPAVWRGFAQKAHQVQFAPMLLAKPVFTPGIGSKGMLLRSTLFAGFFCLNDTLLARS